VEGGGVAMAKKIIYGFVNSGSHDWYSVVGICEDGMVLAGHICSSPSWGEYDIGVTSDRKHDVYAKHCPDGFEVVWVDSADVKTHAGLQEAFRLNILLGDKATLPEEQRPKAVVGFTTTAKEPG